MLAEFDGRSVPSAYRPSRGVGRPLHYVLPTLAAGGVAWFGYEAVGWIMPSSFGFLTLVGVLVAAMVAFLHIGCTLLGAYLARDRSSGLFELSAVLSIAMGYGLQSAATQAVVGYTLAVVAVGLMGRLLQTEIRYCEDCDERLAQASVPAHLLCGVGIGSPIGGTLFHCRSCQKGLIEVQKQYVRQYVNGRPEYAHVRLFSGWCAPEVTRTLLSQLKREADGAVATQRMSPGQGFAQAGIIAFFGSVLCYALVPAVKGTVDWAWVLLDPQPARLEWYLSRNPEGPFVDDANRLRHAAPSGTPPTADPSRPPASN